MCLCITKQETAHKGQARYRRQLLTGGGKRKLEKRNTRMSSDYAGFMSHPIYSSVRFFYILILCLLAVKNRWFLAELGRTLLMPNRNITRLIMLLKRILTWFSSAWGQKRAVKEWRHYNYKGHNASIGQHAGVWLHYCCYQEQIRGLTAEIEDDKSVELLLLFSVWNIFLHAIYIHLSCVIG